MLHAAQRYEERWATWPPAGHSAICQSWPTSNFQMRLAVTKPGPQRHRAHQVFHKQGASGALGNHTSVSKEQSTRGEHAKQQHMVGKKSRVRFTSRWKGGTMGGKKGAATWGKGLEVKEPLFCGTGKQGFLHNGSSFLLHTTIWLYFYFKLFLEIFLKCTMCVPILLSRVHQTKIYQALFNLFQESSWCSTSVLWCSAQKPQSPFICKSLLLPPSKGV